jgi:hypothetical protein
MKTVMKCTRIARGRVDTVVRKDYVSMTIVNKTAIKLSNKKDLSTLKLNCLKLY